LRFPIPPKKVHRTRLEVKRSVFIASVAHTRLPEDAYAFIKDIRREFDDATHNCWAFVAGPPGDTRLIGLSDDGEPHGTAGKPMLNVLLHSDLGEITCVVTRYYGGTKLGTGGLARAYGQAVGDALDSMERSEYIPVIKVETTIEYHIQSQFKRLLTRFEIEVERETFSDHVNYLLTVPEEYLEEFEGHLSDLSLGKALLSKL